MMIKKYLCIAACLMTMGQGLFAADLTTLIASLFKGNQFDRRFSLEYELSSYSLYGLEDITVSKDGASLFLPLAQYNTTTANDSSFYFGSGLLAPIHLLKFKQANDLGSDLFEYNIEAGIGSNFSTATLFTFSNGYSIFVYQNDFIKVHIPAMAGFDFMLLDFGAAQAVDGSESTFSAEMSKETETYDSTSRIQGLNFGVHASLSVSTKFYFSNAFHAHLNLGYIAKGYYSTELGLTPINNNLLIGEEESNEILNLNKDSLSKKDVTLSGDDTSATTPVLNAISPILSLGIGYDF